MLPPDNLTDREIHAWWAGSITTLLDADEDGELKTPIPGIFRASLEGQLRWRLAHLAEEGD